MTNRIKRNRAGWLFVLPSLAGVMVFYLIPFLDVVRRSFLQAVGGGFAGLGNYYQVLTNKAFRLAAGNTFRFMFVCLPLLLGLSLGIALLLQTHEKYREILKSAYLTPLAIPAASVVLLWQLLFDNQGLLNGVLNFFHKSGRDWMNENTAFGVLVFSYIWKNLGYDVILWLAGLLGIQESIYLLQHVFNNWFSELSMDKMAAGSVLLCMVVALFVLLLQRSWDKNNS